MMDDMVVGNVIGITTILVDQISKREFPFARIKRIKEKRIQKRWHLLMFMIYNLT